MPGVFVPILRWLISTRRSSSESLLLRLPQELKDRIFTEVLGAKVLHVDYVADFALNDDDQEADDDFLEYSGRHSVWDTTFCVSHFNHVKRMPSFAVVTTMGDDHTATEMARNSWRRIGIVITLATPILERV